VGTRDKPPREPLAGSINQLLAALTLIGLSLWLARTNRGLVVRALVGVPMLFMMAVTTSALGHQIATATNPLVLTFAVVLLVLSLWITAEAAAALWRHRPRTRRSSPAARSTR
jgi:carbon starvation protein